MLLEHIKLKKDEILIFKLSSSEEIIAKIASVNDTELVLKNACMLIQTQNGPTLIPYLMMGNFEKPLTCHIQNIVAYQEPEPGFLKAYEGSLSSIIVPQKQGLII